MFELEEDLNGLGLILGRIVLSWNNMNQIVKSALSIDEY